jgi:uncharacterized protein YjiS (DUF1127 family)
MLYRPQPRISASTILRAALTVVGGALSALRQGRADSLYLDGANEHLLKDIGVRRLDDERWRHHY